MHNRQLSCFKQYIYTAFVRLRRFLGILTPCFECCLTPLSKKGILFLYLARAFDVLQAGSFYSIGKYVLWSVW